MAPPAPAPAPSWPVIRCCQCNGMAKCLRCVCVRGDTSCTSCLPGDSGRCHNTLSCGIVVPAAASAPPTARRPDLGPVVHSAVPPGLVDPTPVAPPTSSLPSLSAINRSNIPTLQHVPKGVRDLWAQVPLHPHPTAEAETSHDGGSHTNGACDPQQDWQGHMWPT